MASVVCDKSTFLHSFLPSVRELSVQKIVVWFSIFNSHRQSLITADVNVTYKINNIIVLIVINCHFYMMQNDKFARVPNSPNDGVKK